MKIVVLGGCGDMGSCAVDDLLKYSSAKVVIADYRYKLARKMASERGARVEAAFLDARDESSIIQVLEGAHSAIGCIGPFYRFAYPLMSAAIAARINYVDICDDHDPLQALFGLDEKARSAHITCITGLGWTPGISSLMGKRGASFFTRIDSVKMAWIGSAADSAGVAVVKHLLYACTGKVPTWLDGKLREIEAGEDREEVDFPPPLGKVEVFHVGHPEPITMPRYVKAKNITLKGGLTPWWQNRLISLVVKAHLTSTQQRIERVANVVHRVEAIFRLKGIACSGISVEVKGKHNGKPKYARYVSVDKMRRLTGIPAAIGAVMLAENRFSKHGVFPPEGILDPTLFFTELEKHGIKIVAEEP